MSIIYPADAGTSEEALGKYLELSREVAGLEDQIKVLEARRYRLSRRADAFRRRAEELKGEGQ